MQDGAYKEIHLSSLDGDRTGGTRNHPTFEFSEPVTCDKYMIKNAQVPISWKNVPGNEYINIRVREHLVDDPTITVYDWPILIPASYYSATGAGSLQEIVNISLKAPTNPINSVPNRWNPGTANPWWTVEYNPADYPNIGIFDPTKVSAIIYYTIDKFFGRSFDPAFPDNPYDPAIDIEFQFITSNGVGGSSVAAFNVRKFWGFDTSTPSWKFNHHDANNEAILTAQRFPYPVKTLDSNYLFMRSSMSSGTSYAANTQGTFGGYGSQDIVGKIPLNSSENPFGTIGTYINPVGTDSMFSYNGGQIDKMDMFFTKEFTNEEVDFDGFHFTCTLGIWTSSAIGR